MVQGNDVPVIFAEATLISPDERLDLPSVEACDSKGSMKAPVIIATIPIHPEELVVPSGLLDAGDSPTSPPPPAGEGAASRRRKRPVWPIGVGLLIVVMLAVMIVFSVHAAAPVPVSGSPPPLPPQTSTSSRQPAQDSAGNGLIPQDDYNWGELDDKKIDDLMENGYWYNSTYNATDDWYYDDATNGTYG